MPKPSPAPKASESPPAGPVPAEPRLSVSFLGVKVDGSGTAAVRFAFVIALVICGLVALADLRPS
jgi:hypothetical protein